MSKKQDRTSDKDSPVVRKETLRQIDRSQLAKVAGGVLDRSGDGSKDSRYCAGR